MGAASGDVIARFGAGVARGLVGRGTIRVERFAMGMIVHGLPSNRDPLLGALLPGTFEDRSHGEMKRETCGYEESEEL